MNTLIVLYLTVGFLIIAYALGYRVGTKDFQDKWQKWTWWLRARSILLTVPTSVIVITLWPAVIIYNVGKVKAGRDEDDNDVDAAG